MENGTVTLKKSLAVPYKVKQTLHIMPSNSAPGYMQKRNENIHLHSDLYTRIQSSLICKSLRVKQPKCPPAGDRINQLGSTHTMEH